MEPDFAFKKKIVLNYDKLDLARKLEDMTKTVNDFKNHYQGYRTTYSDSKSDQTGRSATMSPRQHEVEKVPEASTAKKSHQESIRTVEDYKQRVPLP